MLIAIEGIDGSGKGTQAGLLRDRLLAEGRRATLLSFPRYAQTRFGKLTADFLNGRFGTLESVSPFLAALLFAGDRFESRDLLAAALAEHEFVICDRYAPSNVAHQAAKLESGDRRELIDFIHELEFEIYGLPWADRVVLLNLSAARAKELIARKSARDYTTQAADLHEADDGYLARVAEVYRELASGNPGWRVVDVERDGRLRAIDDVHAEVYRVVIDSSV